MPIKYDARDEGSIKPVIANSNVIVNCIGTNLLRSHLWLKNACDLVFVKEDSMLNTWNSG